jgi:hypothetical protein
VVRDGSISGNACDGSYSIKTTLKSGQTAATMGFNNVTPFWVNNSSVNGRSYTASVYVRGTPGKVLVLYLGERNSAGTFVNSGTLQYTPTNTAWHLLTKSYTAGANGNSIVMKVWMNSPAATSFFNADNMSLTTP